MKDTVLFALILLVLGQVVTATTELRFEAEDWSSPQTAWQQNKHSDSHWNLWSTDKDAHQKWSEGVVLQSPKVLSDRTSPEDGAPVLHTRITGIPKGSYDVSIEIGRTLGLSRDGKTFSPFSGGMFLMEHIITDGVFELWVDDCYVHQANPGSGYYDYLTFTPIPVVDILGDWREELIVSHPGELRIYGTTIPTPDRHVCLLQDPIYRLDTAMNANGYTQNATLSYFLD